MAFQTTVRYGTDVTLQGVQSVTEDGKPQQVCLQGLQCASQYYVMADLLEDGVRVAQSEKVGFQTLACGLMSVTYSSYRRSSCSEHVVVYTYSSTYAPSSCILHTEGPNGFVANYQGTIDSVHNTVTFEIDDWDGGVNYDVYATLYDIYGESEQSVTTTLTSGTINVITLSVTAQTENTVTLGISKCNDCGFFNGWVDVWLGTEDPNTDPSDFHEYFTSSDTSITITGLSEGTSYWFKATYTCDDHTTEVYSAIVSGTTTAGYSGQYLTIENPAGTYGVARIFYGQSGSSAPLDGVLQYSLDNGQTWNTQNAVNFSYSATQPFVEIPVGGKMLCKSTNNGTNGERLYITAKMCVVYGNILSMVYGDNFRNRQNITIPDYWFKNFFNSSKISSAENLKIPVAVVGRHSFYGMFYGCDDLVTPPSLGSVTTIYNSGCTSMFEGCTRMTTPPDLSGLTTIAENAGCWRMFFGCTRLATPPYLTNLTTFGQTSTGECSSMFEGCTALTTAPNLSGITATNNATFNSMFKDCTALTTPPNMSNLTTIDRNGCVSMFEGCTALLAPPNLSNVTTVVAYGMKTMFKDCSSMTTTPDFSGITTVQEEALHATLQNCSSLTTLPNLAGITRIYQYGCKEMCSGCTSMTSTPVFTALRRVDTYGMELMFENTGLTSGADLSGITTDGNYAFKQMYTWSTSLTSPGSLPNITAPSEGAYSNMYNSCTSLATPPNMSHITKIGRFVCDGMFGGCSTMRTVPDLTSVTSLGYYGCSAMFMACTQITTGADIRHATADQNTGMISDMYNGCRMLTTAYLPSPTDINLFWSQCQPNDWLADVASGGYVIATTQTMLDGAPRNSASGIPSGWTGVVQSV